MRGRGLRFDRIVGDSIVLYFQTMRTTAVVFISKLEKNKER